MADPQIIKAKALTKDSIIVLLDLISKHKVITSKSTNATNNKLKEEAWRAIAQEFSALTGYNRRPEQLRLKWENLKKNARKRSALIRQNNLKTGGGKMFIPPDEVLERVASMLVATCTGLSVEFGGDGVYEEAVGQVTPENDVEIVDYQPLPEQSEIAQSISTVLGGDCYFEDAGGIEINSTKSITPRKFIFSTPNTGLNKRRKLSEEVQRAQRDKDLGLAAYFQAKTESSRLDSQKVDLENKKIELENKKLVLENKKLELQNVKPTNKTAQTKHEL